jgi:hypothetical protein
MGLICLYDWETKRKPAPKKLVYSHSTLAFTTHVLYLFMLAISSNLEKVIIHLQKNYFICLRFPR